jgi:hypothetical protein
MSAPIVSKEVSGTAYIYEGALKCDSNYFWRVKATDPFPSEWSTTFTFVTQPAETPVPTVVQEKQPENDVFSRAVLIMIVVCSLLGICIIVLIIVTRRD